MTEDLKIKEVIIVEDAYRLRDNIAAGAIGALLHDGDIGYSQRNRIVEEKKAIESATSLANDGYEYREYKGIKIAEIVSGADALVYITKQSQTAISELLIIMDGNLTQHMSYLRGNEYISGGEVVKKLVEINPKYANRVISATNSDLERSKMAKQGVTKHITEKRDAEEIAQEIKEIILSI